MSSNLYKYMTSKPYLFKGWHEQAVFVKLEGISFLQLFNFSIYGSIIVIVSLTFLLESIGFKDHKN